MSENLRIVVWLYTRVLNVVWLGTPVLCMKILRFQFPYWCLTPIFFITFHIPCIIFTMALPQLWFYRNYKNVRTNYYCWFFVRSDPLVISVKICLVLFLAIYSSAAFFYLIWIFPTSIMDHFNSGVLINLLWQQQFDMY